MQDKMTIGVTPTNKQLLDRLKDEMKVFEQDTHAAKLALALAIRRGVKPGVVEGTVTAWAVSNFDPDGSLKTLVSRIYNTDTPYRVIEYLINVGLEFVAEEIDAVGNIRLDRLFAITKSASHTH